MKSCLFLLFACLMDALFTQWGVVNGIVVEENPLMRFIMREGWVPFYLIKIVLPILLLGLFYFWPFKGIAKKLLNISCLLYLGVLLYHLSWVALHLHTSI